MSASRRDTGPAKASSEDLRAVQELADGAIDTLAGMLRGTARFAFELDGVDPDEFAATCEAWARHVTMGAPVSESHAATPGRRAWAELAIFYRERRRAEQQFVTTRLGGFKEIIWELVDGLRALSQSGNTAETSIHESLSQLEHAVESGSLDTVRASLGRAVGDIHAALRRRREELDGRLHHMSSRLDGLRDELYSARRAMELDPLTRLYNRGAFDGALRRYVDLAALSGQPLVLMMIDLDHFKRINDEHGHQRGDQVIVAAAACLTRTFLRKNDFVARYGGEEYAAILPDTSMEHAAPLAERLRQRTAELSVQDARPALRVACSIGYTTFRPQDTAETLLARADAALYRAKAAGRNRVESD